MNKLNSTTSSYNSGTSSETSETLSIEEAGNPKTQNGNQSSVSTATNSSLRLTKNWKRMKDSSNDKDNESKRPPWRALNLPPTPKPDRGVLLRAKLLDASRRLRFSKVSVPVQTEDISSAITRDANVGGQTDLILFRDAGCCTEGAYIERRSSDTGKYILTYSVSQMTDAVAKVDVTTQTLLPKMSGDAFLEAYLNRQTDNQLLLKECTSSERNLLQQLHNLPKKFKPIITAGLNDLAAPTLMQPTLSSWRFDCDEWWNEFYSAQNRTQPYTITSNQPKKSFVPLYESMGLTTANAEIDWKRLLMSIDHLIQETKRFTDNVQRLSTSCKRTQQQQSALSDTKSKSYDNFVPIKKKLPSEHWLPIIEKLEKQLVPLNNNNNQNRFNLEEYENFMENIE